MPFEIPISEDDPIGGGDSGSAGDAGGSGGTGGSETSVGPTGESGVVLPPVVQKIVTALTQPEKPPLIDIADTFGFGELMADFVSHAVEKIEGITEDVARSIQIAKTHETELVQAVVNTTKSAADAIHLLFAGIPDDIAEEDAQTLLAGDGIVLVDNSFDTRYQETRDCSCYDDTQVIVPVPYADGVIYLTARQVCEMGGFIAYPACSSPSLVLPMENARLTIGAGACLTHNIPSRDVNPAGSFDPANVYAPMSGDVWLVDNFTGDPNGGYGNFVVLRFPVTDFPIDIQTRIQEKVGKEGGYVYIGYAHLSTIDVSAGEPIPESLLVGVSGSTGSDNVHLDISVIWDEDLQLRASEWGGSDNWRTWENLATNISHIKAEKLDPLDIWPELGPEPSCCETDTCP